MVKHDSTSQAGGMVQAGLIKMIIALSALAMLVSLQDNPEMI